MATTPQEFLLLCIKHTTGRVDFEAVGKEFGISRDAANKRYVRIKKKIQDAASQGGSEPVTPKKQAVKSETATPASNKRKLKHEEEDGEDMGNMMILDTPTMSRTKRRHAEKAAIAIKAEAEADCTSVSDFSESGGSGNGGNGGNGGGVIVSIKNEDEHPRLPSHVDVATKEENLRVVLGV